MRTTGLRISAFALAAALAAFACGGGEESSPGPQVPVAAKEPLAKPKRVESLPAPRREAEPPAAAPIPAELPPLIPPDAPLPEGEQTLSRLPDDVPVPKGARAISPALISPEGISHGTYEMSGSAASAATSYTAGLLQKGWSIEPTRASGAHALISATKGDRQVSIAIEEVAGRAQIVILEMQRPPG